MSNPQYVGADFPIVATQAPASGNATSAPVQNQESSNPYAASDAFLKAQKDAMYQYLAVRSEKIRTFLRNGGDPQVVYNFNYTGLLYGTRFEEYERRFYIPQLQRNKSTIDNFFTQPVEALATYIDAYDALESMSDDGEIVTSPVFSLPPLPAYTYGKLNVKVPTLSTNLEQSPSDPNHGDFTHTPE
ncbi:MAG: hypothetical protein L6R40_004636 [Gallowayella cf. fulva]|nr:MAG: hypothetical protein L6R40_004636 [Xanthomendoza cf. fulva]